MPLSRAISAAALLLAAIPVCHHGLLWRARRRLTPNGTLIAVGDHALHVYTEGGPTPDAPVLVFLSGGGTPDPAYNFRSLYRLLSPAYQIAVVEKPGYGYAPAADVPRDVDTLLHETRSALARAGIGPPYVLFPHSYSGLEALRWAQHYPDELSGIVGLDMAVPAVYRALRPRGPTLGLMRLAGFFGLQRLPFVAPTDPAPLTPEEYAQTRLLTHRNFCNSTVLAEARAAPISAAQIAARPMPLLPLLLFVSSGKGLGPDWIAHQQRFAQAQGCTPHLLDCGHYMHNELPKVLAEACLPFLAALSPTVTNQDLGVSL